MAFEPSKLYIGVIDFFSIMLPGGVLAGYLNNLSEPILFGPLLPELQSDASIWIALLFAAYLLGHIAFLLGSFLDKIYDPIREKIWPKKGDHAYNEATAIKKVAIPSTNDGPLNTFQWCKIMLALKHPPGLVEIERFEADSKFFRTLVIVLIVMLAGVLWVGPRSSIVIVALSALMLLSFFRYVERRYKSTEHAFRQIIVLHSSGQLA